MYSPRFNYSLRVTNEKVVDAEPTKQNVVARAGGRPIVRGTGIPGHTVIAVTTLKSVVSFAEGVPAEHCGAVTRHDVVAIASEDFIVSASGGIAAVGARIAGNEVGATAAEYPVVAAALDVAALGEDVAGDLVGAGCAIDLIIAASTGQDVSSTKPTDAVVAAPVNSCVQGPVPVRRCSHSVVEPGQSRPRGSRSGRRCLW